MGKMCLCNLFASVSHQADGSSDVTEVAKLEQPKGCTFDQEGVSTAKQVPQLRSKIP